MFFEFIQAVLTLDLNWLATLFFSNFHYLFFFAMFCFFFWGPSTKKVVVSTLLLIPTIWLWVDFDMISGWAILVGGFLSVYYITKLVVLTFANDIPFLKNNLIIVAEVHGVGLIVLYNLFLR
jgi:hypothetical protein